ncbi:MAG TPA: hypothetical protein VMK83_02370 [Gaiellaceae bacterium]|nr:hypothetical protein [Gaiellaceae bacterium]
MLLAKNAMTVRAYVDTNLVSAIRRQDRGDEQDALNQLFDAYDNGKVTLVTSPVTKRELAALPAERYAADEVTYRRLGELPEIEPAPLMMLQPITARPGTKFTSFGAFGAVGVCADNAGGKIRRASDADPWHCLRGPSCLLGGRLRPSSACEGRFLGRFAPTWVPTWSEGTV